MLHQVTLLPKQGSCLHSGLKIDLEAKRSGMFQCQIYALERLLGGIRLLVPNGFQRFS